MNSMIFVALLVTVMMGTDRVIGGKQHNTSGQTIAGETAKGRHIKSFAAKQSVPSSGGDRDGRDGKMNFQASAKPRPEDFIECTDNMKVINDFKDITNKCIVEKWKPLPIGASARRDHRECCFMVEKVCSMDKFFTSECTLKDGFAEEVAKYYVHQSDTCKHEGIEVSDDFCRTLHTNDMSFMPMCQRYLQCTPTKPTLSPGGPGGHETVVTVSQAPSDVPHTGPPGSGSGPLPQPKPKPQHSGADTLAIISPLSFVVISLLAFITFIQM